jgi:hypothetical protein
MKKGLFWITLLLMAATLLGGCNTTPTPGEVDGAEKVPFEYTTYELDGERYITLTKYIGEDTDVTVPAAIDGLTVTEIGSECFMGSAVVSVTLPDTVIVADTNAFAECKALQSVTLPENMLYLGAQAFMGCTSLKEITLPASGITEYSWGMFLGAGLETVTLRDGVEVLPTNIFLGSQLKELTIPASVTKIMTGALGGCEQLVRVKFEGNAPVMQDVGVGTVTPGYTVCHHEGAEGFTAPEWDGFAKEIW